MLIPGAKISGASLSSSPMEKLKEQHPHTLKEEKARLRKATKEFESFFMYQLLKVMRKTIPKSTLNKDGIFSKDMSKDIFTDMFDLQMSRKMVKDNRNSISNLLYKSLVKIVDAQYKKTDDKVKIKPLDQQKVKSFELRRTHFKKIPENNNEFKIKAKQQDFFPISHSPNKVTDSILSRYGPYIEEASKETSLDPSLIISVIRAESNGNPKAVSAAGAKGLMQLVDSTANAYNVKQVFDPKENILAGSRYLKDLMERFGDLRLALAAYNAGPANVMRYDGIPPFSETNAYIDRVVDTLKTIKGKIR
ncbi:MAG: transglycosylase SLT domain-containing protein [FCB group bacterium]|nr:transglycosylase SLT domain-containing protein [FCB group bacterium]